MTSEQARWAKSHDWYVSAEQNDGGEWLVWTKENGKLHPWPFKDFNELRAWAGY